MPIFTLAEVDEVHLSRAPLAKVLTQIQFSRTPALVSDQAESAIADRLSRYPVRRHAMAGELTLAVGAGATSVPVQSAPMSPVRLFMEPSTQWQVTVTETSVALETTAYDSRHDFCDRAREVLDAVAAIAQPPVVDRVGLRYIDRLSGDHLMHVGEYLLPQLQVLHNSVDDALAIEHSISESAIRLSADERLLVRSGILPPGGGFDPALPPLPEPSWVLDLDVFTTQGGFSFDPAQLHERLLRYGAHAYAFFRFATTDAFLSAFGPTNDPTKADSP